jgi:hypothetical protein
MSHFPSSHAEQNFVHRRFLDTIMTENGLAFDSAEVFPTESHLSQWFARDIFQSIFRVSKLASSLPLAA